jgi:hypothetical protein
VAKPSHRDAILALAKGRTILREMPRPGREDQLFLLFE